MNVLDQILIKNDRCIIKEFTDLSETKMLDEKDGQSSLILQRRLLVWFHSSCLSFTFPQELTDPVK